MSIFKKKQKSSQYNVVNNKFTPAVLPTYGQALHTFFPLAYSMSSAKALDERYKLCEAELEAVMNTCDHHSSGNEGDAFVKGQMEHQRALHQVEVAEHKELIERIYATRQTREEILEREKAELEKTIAEKEEQIEPLKELRSSRQIKIGPITVSLGAIVTLLAMIVDAAVNFSFLQTVLLSNATMLMITVVCMSVMSDGSMMALGILLSEKDKNFDSKVLYYITCGSLLAMFLLSVVASVMVRYGSMDMTFGTINAAGEFVGKSEYNLAEYGVTLVTAFITAATGILSFACSIDKNADGIAIRRELKKALTYDKIRYTIVDAELSDLKKAPDLWKYDEDVRKAAETNIEALDKNLRLHLRKLLVIKQNDATFTEKMAASAEEVLASSASHMSNGTPMTLAKVS